ncbi:MAG: cell division protein FtsA, partial [Fusobacterium sp. JB020]|nr:cell division protein FtsA [Fusobacterium sp. JB020]
MGNNILKFILDIGNAKIKMLAGELSEDGSKLRVLKYVEVKSEGIKKSIIENPSLLSESIKKAKSLIEDSLEISIEKVNLGVGGTNVCSRTANIRLPFEEEKEIEEKDLEQLYELAKKELKYEDEEILKKEYYNLRVDNAGIVKNPVGLLGKELQGDIHLVLAKTEEINKLKEVVIRAEMEVEGIYLNAYAASRATLSLEDKDKGVALIDIGEGTTDIIIYKNNKMIYVKSLSLGGMHYISDLEYIYKISKEEAIDIMNKAMASKDLEEVFTIGNRKVSTKNIVDAINARTDDFVKFIRNTIQDSGFTGYLGKGICLT